MELVRAQPADPTRFRPARRRVRVRSAGRRALRELTGTNVGKPLAIMLDGKLISAPNINGRRSDRNRHHHRRRQGGFKPRNSNYLVSTLNAGSLPASLTR